MFNVNTVGDRNLENLLNVKHGETREKDIIDSSFSLRVFAVNHGNITVTRQHNESTFHDYGFAVVLGLSTTIVLCMILALVGNILVILTVIRHKGMRTRTNMFIVNLAIADLLVSIFNMPFSLITVIHGRWIFGDSFCQFNGFVTALFLIASIHTLMHISIHKYISITKPFSQTMTNRKIMAMIIASWFWAAICATFTLRIGNNVLYKKGASQCGPSIPDELNEYIHSIVITTFNYILPLFVMTYCYIRIFREIHEHMVRIRQTSNINLENTLNQQRKITCTLFAVLACFLICWTPFILYSCSIAFLTDKAKIPLLANPIAYWCGYMNSACNPIIYALRSPSFRQGYKEIICHYQAYNMGGSLITRQSLSPHGTMRKISSRISPNLLNNVGANKGTATIGDTLFLNSPLANGIIERRNRTRLNEITNDLKETSHSLKAEPKTGLLCSRQKEKFRSLQNNLNQYQTAEQELSPTVIGSKPQLIGKHYSFPLISSQDIMQTPIFPQNEAPRTSVSDIELALAEQLITFGSMSTISKQSYQSINDNPEAVSCPLVVVDAASLKSSTTANPDSWNRRLSNIPSIPLKSHEWCGGSDICTNIDESKWSPMSTKSLEMGRCRRSSTHKRQSTHLSGKAYLGTPESPLYTASKEQLMKWMSEDNLDRSQETAFHFGFGAKLFTSFKNIGKHHKHPITEDDPEKTKMKVQRI